MTLFILLALTAAFALFSYLGLSPPLGINHAALNQAFHLACTVTLLGTLAFVPRKRDRLPIRFFWFCINVALVCWLLTKASLLIAHSLNVAENIYLLADYGYFAYFLVMVFSLLLYNSAHHPNNPQLSSRSLIRQYGALAFMGMMFVYLVIIPSQSLSQEFTLHFSSFLFFILMDAYLVLAFYSQSKASERWEWNRRFFYLSLSFLCFFVLDFLELMTRVQNESPDSKRWVSLLWFSPYFFLAYALKQKPSSDTLIPQSPPAWLPTPELIMLPLLPLLHVLGYFLGVFADDLRSIRELILALWMLFFCTLMYILDKQSRQAPSPTLASHAARDNRSPPLANAAAPKNNAGLVQGDEQIEKATRHQCIAINSVPFAFLILDNKGKIEEANTAITRLTGYQASELKGVFFNALLSNDEPLEGILRFSEGAFSESKLVTSHTREVRIQHKSGRILYCYVGFAEVLKQCFSVCLIDITKLHEAEAQALSIKDKFLANITHEFRTPLTLIQGAIDEGEEQVQETALKHRFSVARSNIHHLIKMVEQLLNLSKITSAPKLAKTVQPASEIMRHCSVQFAHLCEQKNLAFSFHIEEKIWVDVHEDSLQQVLYNLLSNAYKYTPQGGKIHFSSERKAKRLHIRVEDTGVGMTQEEQTQLFGRFQRADISKQSSTFGVGIGLALISELVQLHQWSITVDSSIGKGSCFTLVLPVCDEPQNPNVQIKPIDFAPNAYLSHPKQSHAVANKDHRDNKNNPAPAFLSNNKLLIIEDNLDMQDYLRHLLGAHYQLDITGTGEAGCCYAITEIPDLIICDLMLPDMSGYQVVERIKQHGLTQHIPILMLTAKSDIESKLAGLENRADDYLTKPFHHKELRLRLQNLLSIRERMQALLRQQLNQDAQAKAKHNALPDTTNSLNTHPHQAFLSRLQTTADQHYANSEFGLSLLASDLAMSERQLQRKLKAALNMTPGEYIREYRLMKSQSLLQQGLSVAQVSDAVGFADPAYFTRCFKQWRGIAPSEYQKIKADKHG